MPSLADARASNAAFSPPYTPVAVFVGGTSGVGEAMAKALTSYLGGNLHLFIIGSNSAAAEKTFASLPRPSGVKREFEIKRRVDEMNFLVLSAGYFRVTGRDETEERLDGLLVMRYYCRFTFIRELLPLLHAAKERREDVRVMTVLGTGMTDVSVLEGALKPVVYNDVMIEKYANQNPGIGFVHIYPGVVYTPAANDLYESWGPLRLLAPPVWFKFWLYGIQPEECAEYMLSALLDRVKEEGWSRRNEHGDDIGTRCYNISEEDKRGVWEHSVEETSV
ncbi:hypothetical protein BDZ89DRAFT_1201258 [Hymenopellis radicata]|nr:hypothetical protein BDZ89DRAFT_1201258 [Hymenopellis radicata]